MVSERAGPCPRSEGSCAVSRAYLSNRCKAAPASLRGLRCASPAARVLSLADRLIPLRADRAALDSEQNPGRAKARSEVLVVAEGLVVWLAAATKGGARQGLDGAVLTPHFDLAGHQQRAVFYRRRFRRPVRVFVRPAIEPVVEQRAARAAPHDLGHLVGAGGVRQDPRPPVELEDFALPTQALGDMDAEVQVKADLDIPPPVYLAHPSNIP